MSGGATPDAELVAGVLSGDREALAQVYDRYADRLYDFAYAMLRHREEAADAVADSFVTTTERLGQLRDPGRLRPWLYAVVRRECLRRLTARNRVADQGEERLAAMADGGASPDERAEQGELQQLVWDAAAGLGERDRVLLDLHLRQGLEGAELGEAMGVTAAHAYTMLNRLRTQVERSLGALLVARLGRSDCDDLAELLRDWDGRFSPLVRKRVARHVDRCDVCARRRERVASPLALLAGVPAVAAPAGLRERVLEDPRLVGFTTPGSGGSGPGAPGAESPGRGWLSGSRAAVLAVAGVALLVAGAVGVLVWPGDALWQSGPAPAGPSVTVPGTGPGAAEPSLSLLATPAPLEPRRPTPTPLPTASPTPSPSPTPTETGEAGTPAPAVPARLVVPTRLLELGTAVVGSLPVRNDGEQELTFRVESEEPWLSVAPDSGSLGGGGGQSLEIRVDHDRLPEGEHTGHLAVTDGAREVPVEVRLRVERPPVLARPEVVGSSCSGDGRSVQVSVGVSDESDIASVTWEWSGAGSSGGGAMTRAQQGGSWSGTMGPFPEGGEVAVDVLATDVRGNGAGRSRTVLVESCLF